MAAPIDDLHAAMLVSTTPATRDARAGRLAEVIETPARSSDAARLAFLDGLRGLAAAYVVAGHARWLLWEGHSAMLSHTGEYSLLGRMLAYGSASLRHGHTMVLFFFVLSGYVIHRRYAFASASNTGHDKLRLLPYLSRRVRRLYPPLVFALVVTAGLDLLGRHLGYTPHTGHTPYPQINKDLAGTVDLPTALGNLAFVMQTYVPQFGTNGPLWSLKYEFWFYVLYPAFWLLGRRAPWAPTFLLAFFFLSALVWPFPVRLLGEVLPAMSVWWLGVLLAERSSGRVQVRRGLLWACLPALGVIPTGLGLPQVVQDLATGLFFFGLLGLLIDGAKAGRAYPALDRLSWLGESSYTLYVSHVPVLALFSGWLMSRSSTGELPRHLGFVVCGVIVCIALAWAAHFFVERPFVSRPPRRCTGQ